MRFFFLSVYFCMLGPSQKTYGTPVYTRTPHFHVGCLELTQVTITCAGNDSLRGNYFIHQMQLLLGRMRVHVTFQSKSSLRLRYTRLVL